MTTDLMDLPETAIQAQYDAATGLLDGFDHTPRLARARSSAKVEPATRGSAAGVPGRRRFRSTTPGLVTRSTARPDGVHLMARIEAVAEDPLPTTVEASLLQSLRRALAIALAAGETYAKATGLSAHKSANLAGALPKDKGAEFTELLAAEALVSAHVFANATAFLLAPLAQADTQTEVGAVDEILTDNAPLALQGCLWELDQIIAAQSPGPELLVSTVIAYAEQAMEKIALRAANAPRLAPFTETRTRIEADDLTLDGFTPAARGRSQALTMSFKKPHEVVGNHIAKHQAQRLSRMLMAYDFSRKLNPFAELGGFIFTFMGDGAPGTGKTTLIQMMAGLLNDYCAIASYPFRYANLSTDQIDSYQGKSAQNAKAFINTVLDPNAIGFGTIDDIDQLAGKRGDRQSSAGQLEITAVLMESFAGANTVVRGNCTFGMFSNYPENVDDALRQRAGARFLVDGPQSRDDYIDILTLLMGKHHDIPLGDHELYAAQELKRAVAQSFASHARPHEDALANVFDRVSDKIGTMDTLAKLGTYLKAIQEADPRFTGRAIKNITDAVKTRAMDFDIPDDWMEDPDLFLFRDYDAKRAMIEDLRRPITPEMVLQEINRYADSEFRYADKSDEVAIENMVRDFSRSAEAKRRYLSSGGDA